MNTVTFWPWSTCSKTSNNSESKLKIPSTNKTDLIEDKEKVKKNTSDNNIKRKTVLHFQFIIKLAIQWMTS